MALENKQDNGTRVRLDGDGKYRWTYSLDMYRNPSILLVVLKIFGILWAVLLLVVSVPSLLRGETSVLAENGRIWAWVTAVFFAVCLLSYLIVARMYGGRYVVDFTMDEKGIVHSQSPSQVDTARKVAGMTALAGAASGRPGTLGAGALATRTDLSSDFSRVRRIQAFPRRDLIKVNARFSRNQVYVHPEDFAFVLDYIRSHCPHARW